MRPLLFGAICELADRPIQVQHQYRRGNMIGPLCRRGKRELGVWVGGGRLGL